MRDSTGQDRRQIDLLVLYHDVLVHFGVRVSRRGTWCVRCSLRRTPKGIVMVIGWSGP